MFNKILIYGEFWEGTLPWLAYEDLSVRFPHVKCFDYTDYMPGIKERNIFQRVERRLFGNLFRRRINEAFQKTLKKFQPDLVLVIKGLDLDSRSIRQITEIGAKSVNWNPDDFFNLKTSNSALIENLPLYDFIVSSRPHLFSKYLAKGAKNMIELQWYYVPQFHYDFQLPRTDRVAFVGSWSPSRENFLSNLSFPIDIWGGGWHKSKSRLRKKHNLHDQILSQKEMGKVFNSSRLSLNCLTTENQDKLNLRMFEVLGAKGVLVTNRNRETQRLLRDRVDCLMYSDLDELYEIVSSSADYDIISANGYARARDLKSSFNQRVDELIVAVCQKIN